MLCFSDMQHCWPVFFFFFTIVFYQQVEYKYDKEMLKGCVIPVVDDKLTLLCMKNAEMASEVSFPICIRVECAD